MSDVNEIVKLSELINPFERQKDFFKSIDNYKYSLYGGAKGGGKSYILRWASVRQLLIWAKQGLKNVRVGLFCEDYPSLKDRQITKIKAEFPEWLGTLSDSQVEGMSFVLKPQFGGGILALRNLDDPSKYASSEFAMVAIDELTKNPRTVFDQFRSIIRWTGIEDTKFIGGTNPGEIGHVWVKKIWIDREFTNEDPDPDEIHFVQCLPTDNPHLAKGYIEELKKLPEKLRKAYLEGNWDVFEGQFFMEWDKNKHVVRPFKIPDNWKKFRTIDVGGRNGITCCYWCAVDYDGQVWVYREHYGTGMDSDEHARRITELSEGEKYQYTVIDNSAFDKIGLPETTAEIYIKNGVNDLVPCSKKRIMGWDIMHQYLRWDKDHEPRMKFFDVCVNAIKTIPMLIHDDKKPEDVDTRGLDHSGDSIRYILQTLREIQTPKPMTYLERRLKEIKENKESFKFQY